MVRGDGLVSFIEGRSGALLCCHLARLFLQDHAFFLLGPQNDRFHAAAISTIDRPKAWCVYMYAYVRKCTRRPK